MTITQLKYAISVDSYRHFGIAAEKVFVSQPTLSIQIQKLEEQLGILIFDRSKQPVEPTEIGKKILLQARIILQESDRIIDIVKQNKGIIDGEFRLGIIPTVTSSLLPRFLKNFSIKYENVQLKIEELQTDQIIEKLKKDQLDAGILSTPLQEFGIIEKQLYYEPFVAYVPNNHRLSKDEFILYSDIDFKDLLLLKEGHCFRNSILNICGNSNTEQIKKVEIESGNFDTLIKLSDEGFGMTLIPYLFAVDLKGENKNEKNIKAIEDPKPSREISIVYSRAQLKISIINALAQEIKTSVPKALLNSKSKVISPISNT
jgi:LysR family transcriptional regulator, hydrogen peroxide-inducible genes activator